MASRFSIEAVFKAIDKISAPVSKIQNRVGKFTRGAQARFEKLNRTADKFGQKLKKGAVIATGALLLTTTAMADVITTGAGFEQTIVNAAAKFPGAIRKGTDAFEQLEKAARETGATTEFTASQSAEALNFLAMAGFNAQSAVAALPGVVDLATAAQVDLATATDIASDSLGAFGLATKDPIKLGENLARINDVIAKTATSANTTVEDMFEAIKEGAPVATTAGAEIETFSALVGELANSGIKGSRAGTTLKNMFLSLSAPTAEAQSALKRLGVQTVDSNGDLIDVIKILGNLNKSLDGLGTAERSGVLKGIFGKIPIAGVNVLLDSGSKKLDEYRKQLEGASGASSEMASVMRDTVKGRLNALKSAIEGVKISIFSMNKGPLADVIDRMTDWVRANEDLIASEIGGFLADLIENFDEIVSTIKKVTIVLGVLIGLKTALSTFIGVMTAVNLVMAANPVGIVVLGVMALIAALVALVTHWDDVKDAAAATAAAFGAVFSAMFDTVAGIFQAIEGMMLKVAEFFAPVDALVAKIGGVFGFGGDEEAATPAEGSNVISPQERIARSIQEKKQTSEITIKDETGRAEQTGGVKVNGLTLLGTGGF